MRPRILNRAQEGSLKEACPLGKKMQVEGRLLHHAYFSYWHLGEPGDSPGSAPKPPIQAKGRIAKASYQGTSQP